MTTIDPTALLALCDRRDAEGSGVLTVTTDEARELVTAYIERQTIEADRFHWEHVARAAEQGRDFVAAERDALHGVVVAAYQQHRDFAHNGHTCPEDDWLPCDEAYRSALDEVEAENTHLNTLLLAVLNYDAANQSDLPLPLLTEIRRAIYGGTA